MLVDLQPIYLPNVLGMSSKSSGATLWKFLDLKPSHFAVRIAAPLENNRITTKELGERVWYFINKLPQICRYIESCKRIFLEIAETIPLILLICGFAVDFNFFTANPRMVAERNQFPNPQT